MGTFTPYEVPGIQMGPNGRYPHGGVPGGFAPQHLCLAYIKFEPAGALVRHAYFPMSPNLQAFATAEFSSVAATGQWIGLPIRSEVNFENFTFGSQQLIIFHIDPAGAPIRFDPDNLVQFAEYSARDPAHATRKERNNCFLNPEILRWPGKEVLSLENWFVDAMGRPMSPGSPLYYTMNLHALARCTLAGPDDRTFELPVVLDPETGNGTGNEP
ncbi:MAG TPA: hypothetical protein VIT45_06275 [Allosphingosinicella sp.]